MRKAYTVIPGLIIISVVIVLYAYRGTWGKVDLEFRIHINEQLVRESVFGESPTFAIWLENSETGINQTVFVTRRAAAGDWEGKSRVPVALPKWFQIYQIENQAEDVPTYDDPAPLAITGATPKPGYFNTRVRVAPNSKWICWIEMNLSGDYNEIYPEYDPERNIEDSYGTGQPALLYKVEIEALKGKTFTPQIAGMCILDAPDGQLIQPMRGITSAEQIFDEISVAVVKPNPKILNN